MAKGKRTVIGSIVKSKDPAQPDYLKINKAINLKEGQILRLESKKEQLKSVDYLVQNNKISADVAKSIRERIEKMPDFVRFEVVAREEV